MVADNKRRTKVGHETFGTRNVPAALRVVLFNDTLIYSLMCLLPSFFFSFFFFFFSIYVGLHVQADLPNLIYDRKYL